jgi:diguanylate cyclase (GGDEF)-like protein
MATELDSRETPTQVQPVVDSFSPTKALPLDLVAALAGDRPPADPERELLESLRRSRGDQFYSDVLYAVSHRSFAPAAAADLWTRILEHKMDMSYRMGRNVRIAVASLDYLSNLTGDLRAATVIDEPLVAELVRLSQHDGLTGLYNHACCYERLDAELQRYARYGTVVSLMMVDIDSFKALNDRYGHVDGDQMLTQIAATIRGAVRESDSCCRYGGEEFAVILPSTGAPEAGQLAERLRGMIAAASSNGHSLTVSIGVAQSGPGAGTSEALVRRADRALYRAKSEGKDRVAIEG